MVAMHANVPPSRSAGVEPYPGTRIKNGWGHLFAELDRATWGAAPYPAFSPDELSPLLLSWLRKRLGTPGIGYETPLTRLPGGTDTHTFRFRLTGAPERLARSLVLRLYYREHGAARALREARIQRALAPTAIRAPSVHFVCTDESVLGGPFFIMQFLAGKPMAEAGVEAIPAMLAEAHLLIHRTDPAPVVELLRKQGEAVAPHRADEDLAALTDYAQRYPSLAPVTAWMAEHLPSPPARLSICHGDFHPLNIAVRGGKVTGVFDWPDFMLADPVVDIASTLAMAIPARHLLFLDPRHRVWERYLESYCGEAPVDLRVLDYYRVRRALVALLAGAGGRAMWRHPAILHDVIAGLRERTGAALESLPPWEA